MLPDAAIAMHESHSLTILVRSVANVVSRMLTAVIAIPGEAEIVPFLNGHLVRNPAAIKTGDHNVIVRIWNVGRIGSIHGSLIFFLWVVT